MAKISVIVPIYKVEKYLARCVDSILVQTFKEYELILVDDGSPDNCPAMCDEYAEKDKRIKVIHQQNQGVSVARNIGIEYALTTDSDWISFIDSDDWVHPQYLEILYKVAIKSKVNIVSCGFTSVEDECGDYKFYTIKDIKVLKDNTERLYVKAMNTYSPCFRLYKKTCFLTIRFPVGKLFEDMRTIYKVLYNCKKVACVINKLYYYFYNENGATLSAYTLEQSIDEINANEEHLMFLYNNKYYLAAGKKYKGYYMLVKKLLEKYKGENVDILYNHFCEVRDNLYNNKKYVKILKEYEKELRICNLNNDFRAVKEEKNMLYAILFYLKNFLKVYKDKE